MTGHLVLSTLHTNDAVSALTRLADIGLDLGNLATALRAVIAQRLVRRLCPECSKPVEPLKVPSELRWLLADKDTRAVRQAVGCPACRNTGYRGRLAVSELLIIDEESRQVMSRSADRAAMLQLARRSGMNSLWDTGMQRVLDGQTSIEELAANITPPLPEATLPQADIDALLKQLLPASTTAAEPTQAQVLGWSPAPGEPVTDPKALRASTTVQRQSIGLVIAPRATTSSDRHRVMVVHEEHHHRRALRRALESVGCVVLEAADGESALTFASCLRPDAVVTEVVLPKLNGVGLAQALLSEQIVDHVFVCTDQRDELLLQWVVGTGVTDVIAADEEMDVIAARIVRQLPQRSVGLKVVS
jgi:CheY-like chemotaxis protein